MQSQNGRQSSELKPPDKKLPRFMPSEMTSNIMRPTSESGVCCRRREKRLELQRLPINSCISAEPDWVPLPTESTPAAEDDWPSGWFSSSLGKMQMIQTHKWINNLTGPLLPIDPPEIHASRFQRPVQNLKVIRPE
jgi:hypothetical protein